MSNKVTLPIDGHWVYEDDPTNSGETTWSTPKLHTTSLPTTTITSASNIGTREIFIISGIAILTTVVVGGLLALCFHLVYRRRYRIPNQAIVEMEIFPLNRCLSTIRRGRNRDISDRLDDPSVDDAIIA